MIRIDGSEGEGGGQVLRSALALSSLTGEPFEMVNIRGGREQPGLKAQHLQAVAAAVAVSRAHVEGAHAGSRALFFKPEAIRTGDFQFDIGTAGATTLVLQTILLPLSFGKVRSNLRITGGTHVPWSPCYHYLELQWLPYLREIGLAADLSLERAGFYPRGGGQITATVDPVSADLKRLSLIDRGRLEKVFCLSASANLERSIAERQSSRAQMRLDDLTAEKEFQVASMPSIGKGTLLLILGRFSSSRCCYFALGERGKPAERVADEAVDQFMTFLQTDGAIDEYLADQLLLPLAFAKGRSEIKACVTSHLLTNAGVIRLFFPGRIEISGVHGKTGVVTINGL